jgi:hypothetical protein
MKKSNIMMTAAAALVALVAVTGIAISTFAQDAATDTTEDMPCYQGVHQWLNLTDGQKAELEAKKQEMLALREANHEKIEAAMEEGYDAWVEAITEVQGAGAPILNQINGDNFSRFVEGHNYMEQGREIFEELGINRGFGKRGMHGRHGFFKPMGGFNDTLSQ